jgi:hypothetical protein
MLGAGKIGPLYSTSRLPITLNILLPPNDLKLSSIREPLAAFFTPR